jgi:hypothetical protein
MGGNHQGDDEGKPFSPRDASCRWVRGPNRHRPRGRRLGHPDLPPEGAVNVTNPEALTDPGPQDPGLAGHEPSFLNPPATDVNGMPQF